MGKKVKPAVEPQSSPKPVTKQVKKPLQKAPATVSQVSPQQRRLSVRSARLTKIRSKLPRLVLLDSTQISAAVQALKALNSKKEKDLLDIGDDFVYLEIVLSKVPAKHSIKPVQIALPVPIYSKEMNSKFCIFCKNPQRAYKDFIADMDIPLVQRVIEYSKIEKKFPTYTDKRKLFYEYDLFFCDQTIYPLLAKATGKKFYESKKIPFPIDGDKVPADVEKDISSSDYADYLNSLSKYTYFSQGNGPSYTLKVARIGFQNDDIIKNVMQGCYNLLPHLFFEAGMSLSTLRMISIKLGQSVSLPIHIRVSDREKELWGQQMKL